MGLLNTGYFKLRGVPLDGDSTVKRFLFWTLFVDNEGQIPPSAESRDIFGILGIINLLAGINNNYALCLTPQRHWLKESHLRCFCLSSLNIRLLSLVILLLKDQWNEEN